MPQKSAQPAERRITRPHRELFAQIVKVSTADHIVEGCLAAEEIDMVGEILDYKSSKPYFRKWNQKFAEKTDGQSVGNLRAMHGKVAAGKFLDMEYDDEGKAIYVRAKVIDDAEWEKVEEGVYTGFSIGAQYIRKWRDGQHTRWTANPYEGSLVDNPAIPSATFTKKLADGTEEICEFQTKGLGTVGSLGYVIQQLGYLRDSIEAEEEYEQDDSTVPGELCAAVTTLLEIFERYTVEEVAEEIEQHRQRYHEEEKAHMGDKANEKSGATHSKATKERFQKLKKQAEEIVKELVEMMGGVDDKGFSPTDAGGIITGAPRQVPGEDPDQGGQGGSTLGRAATGGAADALKRADVEKIVSDTVAAAVERELLPFAETMKALAEMAAKLAGQPVPTRVALRSVTVDKASDTGNTGEKKEKTITEVAKESPQDAIKMIHQTGGQRFLTRGDIAAN